MFSGQSLEEAAPLDLPEPMRRCREPSRSSSVRLTIANEPRARGDMIAQDRRARRLHSRVRPQVEYASRAVPEKRLLVVSEAKA
jgi:hypothetical protein